MGIVFPMTEDKKIKQMASLLQRGATMLDKYCPACENILFRLKNGQIICPICEKEIRIVKEENKKPNLEQLTDKVEILNGDFGLINNNLTKKFMLLLQQMMETNDLILIEKITEIELKILELLKGIRAIKNGGE